VKITFSNLGSIKKTELELRPLTVIIGPNNTSKTYVAYSIYGLWQKLRELLHEIIHVEISKDKKGAISTDIEKVVLALRHTLWLVKDSFRDGLDSYFQDSTGKLFSRTDFGLDVEDSEVRSALEHVLSARSYRWDAASVKHGHLTLVPSAAQSILSGPNQVGMAVTRAFLQRVASQLFPTPFLLPAERNAFVITYKMLATRRFRLMRDAQRELVSKRKVDMRMVELLREQGDIRYPMPIEDFLDFLTDVELADNTKVTKGKRSPLAALADDIETNIQGSHRTRVAPTRLGGSEIKVDVKRGLSIDLYNASSSIKQLAPLLLFLRYRATENSFVIIDEPEMNLHPESQAKVLEALCIMVNLGVRVLLTTHSPYFMAHLNNLVAGSADAAVRKRQSASLYMGDERAFLPMDKVSAYEMKDGKLISLKDEDYGIRWDTLSDVSAELQQRYFAIREAGGAGDGESK
jgi:hypothetical protein